MARVTRTETGTNPPLGPLLTYQMGKVEKLESWVISGAAGEEALNVGGGRCEYVCVCVCVWAGVHVYVCNLLAWEV